MKKSLLVVASFLALSTNAFAAIQAVNFSCGVTHQKGRNAPIPDAPSFSLECFVRAGGVSGFGQTCDLVSHSVFPVGRENTTPMQTVSESRGIVVFRAGDTTAHVNFRGGTAEITLGFGGEAECKVDKVQVGRAEQ